MNNDNHTPLNGRIRPEPPTRRIRGYALSGPDTLLDIPAGAELLNLRVFRGAPTLFMLVPDAPAERHRFVVLPSTGALLHGAISSQNYVGTIGKGQNDCLHVFEVPLIGDFVLGC